jgi:hypothetical protein
VRAVMYAVNQKYSVAYSASTNKSGTTIVRMTQYTSVSTNNYRDVAHSLRTRFTVGEGTLP